MEDMELREGEQIDDLLIGGLKIIQRNENFRYGTDAVILSRFAEISDRSLVLDIGTGSGILPILLSNKNKTAKFIGIDIQEKMVETATRSALLNNLNDRVEFKTLDIKEATGTFKKRSFDTIVTNPPYKRMNSGIVNEDYSLYIARNEVLCTLEDIIFQSSLLLKDKGTFFMVQRIDRLADSIELMRKYKIEPKVLTLVFSNPEKPPVLFLIKGIFGAGPELKVTAPLVIE